MKVTAIPGNSTLQPDPKIAKKFRRDNAIRDNAITASSNLLRGA